MGNLSTEVQNMENSPAGQVKNSAERTLTPIKAIRAYCLGCSDGSASEVRLCPITDCELYPYREGHNPNIKPRKYSDEERARMREHGRAMRAMQMRKNDEQP